MYAVKSGKIFCFLMSVNQFRYMFKNKLEFLFLKRLSDFSLSGFQKIITILLSINPMEGAPHFGNLSQKKQQT